jgi:PAS domain S-box-containing protein
MASVKLTRDELHAGLRSVLDTALDAVVIMDIDGRVLGWNAHAGECFGWSAAAAVGRKLSDLIIPPRYRPAHEQGLKHYLETGAGPVLNRRIEVDALHRDGREIPVELSITEAAQFGERLFIGFIRDISERKGAAERQQRLLSELNHRVKNMLSVVLAVAHQTARHSPDIATFQKSFAGRLETLAEGHDLLVASEWKEVDLEALARRLLAADAEAGPASFSGEAIELSPNRVIGLALILHELYTNAVKYGALASAGGRIDLDWRLDEDEAVICWRESGLEKVREPSDSGFGRPMIAMTARADLQGDVDFDWRPDGLVVTIRFPAAG